MGNQGYIKLERKLLNWGWFQKSEMVHLWVYLLLTAQREDTTIKGIPLKRGQVLFGRKQASKDTGISEQTLRTSLNRLKSTNEVTIKSTKQYTIITLIKYDDYQGWSGKSTNKSTNELTNNQPTTNQQLTTYNNTNNTNNTNNNKYYVPSRTEKKEFIKPTLKQIEGYCIENGYATVSAKKFYEYYEENGWTVKSKGQRKKMQNWKLALNNWVLNEIRYNDTNDLKNRSREAYIKDVELRQKAEERKNEGGNWFD